MRMYVFAIIIIICVLSTQTILYSGVKLTKSNEGITESGDGTNSIIRTNVLDDYYYERIV